MDALTFISGAIKSLAWPATFLVTVFLFRKGLAKVLLRLTKLKYKDIEAEFDFKKELEEAKTAAAEIPLPLKNPAAELDPSLEALPYPELPEVSPRGAIVEAWVRVEAAALKAAQHRTSTASIPLGPARLGVLLRDLKFLDQNGYMLYHRLSQLRNKAVHHADSGITSQEAREYVQLAADLVRVIEGRLNEGDGGNG